MLRRFAWGGRADKKRRLRAIWYVLPLPPSLVGKIFFASAWRYGYTGSVPLLRRKEEDSYETRNRWSVRDESLVRPNHLSPPSNAFPSEFYWRSCDERWMNLERQGLPLRGGIFVQEGGESLAALLRLLPFNLPFFRDLPVESSTFQIDIFVVECIQIFRAMIFLDGIF